MRRMWMSRIGHIGRWLAVLLLALLSVLPLAAPARAAGDTVTGSTANGATFTYGGVQPSFTVVVNLGAKLTGNYFLTAYVSIDGGSAFGSVNLPTQSTDGLTLTFTGIKADGVVAVGQHSAVAHFTNPDTKLLTESAPFTFTVNKATKDMACGTQDDGTLLGASAATHIQMSLLSGEPPPSEWLSGTYNVTFDGPTHVSYTNLTSDSNYVVTVNTPSQIGLYTLSCAFNGSASYTPVSLTSNSRYTVSAMRNLGQVQLYTNPTTLAAGRSADFYVAFHPASGLPMPTGQFSVWLGQNYTNAITLGPTGAYLIHFQTIPNLAGVSRIEIFYMGDKNYNRANVYFPLTNPPIPSGTNAGGSGNGSLGNKSNATPPPTPPADSATATTDSGTPTAVGVGKVIPASGAQSGGDGGLIVVIIIAVLALVALGLAAGAVIYLMRRRAGLAASAAARMDDNWPGAPAGQWDATGRWNPADQRGSRPRGQWDDDTYPYRRGDR